MSTIKEEKKLSSLNKLVKDLEGKKEKGWYGEVIVSFKGGAVEKAGFTENKKYL